MIPTRETIERALALPNFDAAKAHVLMTPIPRGDRPPDLPGQPRQGAVLAITFLRHGEAYLLLTRRRDDLNDHAGQISFPGGQREEGETLSQASLREAQEEVGVSSSSLKLLGQLCAIYIPPTDFEVHPFVAWHDGHPRFLPQEREVAEIIEVPLSHLLDPASRKVELWDIRGFSLEVPFYLIGEHKVWGATAIMISELIERLRMVMQQ